MQTAPASALYRLTSGGPVVLLLLAPLVLPVLWVAIGVEPALFLPFWALIFSGLVVPIAIIVVRHHIRRTRIRQINLFARSFGTPSEKGAEFPSLSFEFVRGKYYTGLDNYRPDSGNPTESDLPFFPFLIAEDRMLLVAAVPFMLVSMLGTTLLFAPLGLLPTQDGATLLTAWFPPNLLTVGSSATTRDLMASHADVLAMAGIAFAGAYLFALRTLLRAVVVFDLNPATFLRVFAHIATTMTVAVILFRAVEATGLSDQMATVAGSMGFPSGADEAAGTTSNLRAWFVLAFAIGFIPEGGLSYALVLSRMAFKTRYSQIERHAKQIPLTVIDGIDPFIAFRLEEANIYDVQNLATYNPIMLDIESPFGIYQTMDWVAQAQLCTVVGVERFLLFRAINLRTIFDLKRVVLDPKADASLLAAIGRILLRDTDRDRDLRREIGLGDAPMTDADLATDAVRRLTEMMLDDLHFRRLERVCDLICQRIEADSRNVPAQQPGSLRDGLAQEK
jgi:hypothetical protein